MRRHRRHETQGHRPCEHARPFQRVHSGFLLRIDSTYAHVMRIAPLRELGAEPVPGRPALAPGFPCNYSITHCDCGLHEIAPRNPRPCSLGALETLSRPGGDPQWTCCKRPERRCSSSSIRQRLGLLFLGVCMGLVPGHPAGHRRHRRHRAPDPVHLFARPRRGDGAAARAWARPPTPPIRSRPSCWARPASAVVRGNDARRLSR